jgi:hypothetical protein
MAITLRLLPTCAPEAFPSEGFRRVEVDAIAIGPIWTKPPSIRCFFLRKHYRSV